MPMTLNPIEYFRVRVKFLTAAEGGRGGPVDGKFGLYRPNITLNGETFHGAVFLASPKEIALGRQTDVEIAFSCCQSTHGFNPGDVFYLHDGPRRVAEGTVLEKGVKQYVRPDEASD